MRWVKSTEELPKLNDWGISEDVLAISKKRKGLHRIYV